MSIETSTTTTITRPSPAASAGLLLARLPIGVYFIMAAINKFMIKPDGVATFVDLQLANAMRILPEQWARVYLGALPYAEIALGALLIMGFLTRVVAGLMSLMLISFTIGATGLVGPAGQPFHPNVVYLGTTLAIMLCGAGRISVDGVLFAPRRRLVVADEIDRRVVP